MFSKQMDPRSKLIMPLSYPKQSNSQARCWGHTPNLTKIIHYNRLELIQEVQRWLNIANLFQESRFSRVLSLRMKVSYKKESVENKEPEHWLPLEQMAPNNSSSLYSYEFQCIQAQTVSIHFS